MLTASTAPIHEGWRPEVSKMCCSSPVRASAPEFLGRDDVVLNSDHVGDAGHAPVPGAEPRELYDDVDRGRDLAPQR